MRPSLTAQFTTLGRALELTRAADRRIVTDRFAPVFLDALHRRALAALGPAPAVRRVAERSAAAGIATSTLCRHACVDAHLLGALPECDQVLVLGAGYDSRAYRLARPLAGRPVVEVDLAAISRRKAAVVAAHPELFAPAAVERVEIDFRTETLPTRLAGARFVRGAPTVVVWEGVAMYLERAAVAETLTALRAVCGPGSVLVLDLWQGVPGRSPAAQLRRTAAASLRLIGEPIRFALPAADAPGFLADFGLETVDLATAPRLTSRYATDGRRCDEGLYVVAARLH